MIRIKPNRRDGREPEEADDKDRSRGCYYLRLERDFQEYLDERFSSLFPAYAKKRVPFGKSDYFRRLLYLAARVDQAAGQEFSIGVLENLAQAFGVSLDTEKWAPKPYLEPVLFRATEKGMIEINLDDPQLLELAEEAKTHFPDMRRNSPSARMIMLAMGLPPMKALALSTFIRRRLTKRMPLP